MTSNKKVISIMIFGALSLIAIGILNLLAEASTQIKDFLTLNKGIGPYSGKVLLGLIIGLIAWSISYLVLKEKKYTTRLPISFFDLTERQKEIVRLSAHPEATLTNASLQKRFSVSQITASRDLARLTGLGLLFAHGRGRSIYYTKV